MKKSIPKNYILISILLAFVFSLTIHINLISSVIFDDIHGRYNRTFSFDFVIFQFTLTFITAIVIFLWNYSFYKPFKPEIKINIKKILTSIISSLVIFTLFFFLAILSRNILEIDVNPRRDNEEMISRNLFCTIIVLGSILVIRFIKLKQIIQLEVEQLRTQSLQSQFESLKNQISPHFLFNSLTALTSLIEDNPEVANTYITHLSQVLRHSLQSHKKELVILEEELEFTQSYIFLLKIRYGTNLFIEANIDSKYYHFYLPPLTMQILVENAVKHNEISKEYNLKITIQITQDSKLQVKNNIQKKLTHERGTGIGLSNLSKLYKLLGEDDVMILEENKEFIVEVPLIKSKNYESPYN